MLLLTLTNSYLLDAETRERCEVTFKGFLLSFCGSLRDQYTSSKPKKNKELHGKIKLCFISSGLLSSKMFTCEQSVPFPGPPDPLLPISTSCYGWWPLVIGSAIENVCRIKNIYLALDQDRLFRHPEIASHGIGKLSWDCICSIRRGRPALFF